MPNTNFVIPLKDIASIDTYRLIHFKSEKTLEELQTTYPKAFDISLAELAGPDYNPGNLYGKFNYKDLGIPDEDTYFRIVNERKNIKTVNTPLTSKETFLSFDSG